MKRVKIKISIITVVYNDKNGLEKTILSIVSQKYKNIEYIIIDGGSDDGTVDIIGKYEDNIDYYISEKDDGIYDAMNKGINVATGDYIMFLNAADSFSDNEVLFNVKDKIYKERIKPDIVYGGANIYSENGDFLAKLKPLEFNKRNLDRYANRTVCHQSIFVHKKAILHYSHKYQLKGELHWYYDLVHNIEKENILEVDVIICDYYLGGCGDQKFFTNLMERIKVTKDHNDIFVFILLIPFFLLPLLFRIRRLVFGR